MKTVSFRTKRNVSDLILELDTGELTTFLFDSPSPNRQSKLILLAVEISNAYEVEVDLEVTVNFGRRPKRLDFVFKYESNLVVGGVSSGGKLISEVARISLAVDAVRDETSRMKKDLSVIGFVFESDGVEKLTPSQAKRYSENLIYSGTVVELSRVLGL